ncbi:hypothetical protein V8B97DRAFT_1970516 [Scleroderma yunnanense]
MVFHWVFIPWLQVELNNYQDHINNSHKCHNRKKVLPHGIPELIYTCAQDYGALDFKVMVSPAALCCLSIGCSTAWTVYHDLLSLVHLCEGIPAILTAIEDLLETEGYMGGVANGLGLHKAQHIQAMNELSNDEPEIDNAIDAMPSLLVTQFSSDNEDKEADVDHSL